MSLFFELQPRAAWRCFPSNWVVMQIALMAFAICAASLTTIVRRIMRPVFISFCIFIIATSATSQEIKGFLYIVDSDSQALRLADTPVLLCCHTAEIDSLYKSMIAEIARMEAKTVNSDSTSSADWAINLGTRIAALSFAEILSVRMIIQLTNFLHCPNAVECRTDINGSYHFQNVAPGNYYLYALYGKTMDTEELAMFFLPFVLSGSLQLWMEPVRVRSGVQNIDLSQSKSIDLMRISGLGYAQKRINSTFLLVANDNTISSALVQGRSIIMKKASIAELPEVFEVSEPICPE